MKAFLEARKRILGAAAIVLLILLMMNLNSRLGEYFRLDEQRDKLGTQLSSLELTQFAMQTQVMAATSDEAVRIWAYESHLALTEDKIVVVLTPANNMTTPEVVITPEPRVFQNWEVWWALFFSE